jgi:pimeloyl-ACP methyl ester carboxylesterase
MSLSFPTRALFVPGRGEAVADFLAWRAAFDEVGGIDFDDRFARLGFGAQVAQAADLIARAHSYNTLLVGRSFGAWLVLHALLGRTDRFDGTVLLLAPVLGYGGSGNVGFIGPRARIFWKSVEAGRPMPASRVVLVAGLVDAQCPIELARRLARWWPIELHEWRVGHVLDAWTSADLARKVEAVARQNPICEQ